MHHTTYHRTNQQGAVSLFIVIFAALLLMVVTISFIQLMTKDQRQATASDISQSAYDSAQAGVEDGKRVLLVNQACEKGLTTGAICNTIRTILNSPTPDCDTVAKVFGGAVGSETKIQARSGDATSLALDQAYTCVTIDLNTDDYVGSIGANQSDVIPLVGASAFDRVEISWVSKKDIADGAPVTFPSNAPKLPAQASWGANSPALLRAQFMQTGNSFKLADFDDSQAGKSNVNTLFLYPTKVGGVPVTDYALDARRTPGDGPQLATCSTTFGGDEYLCRKTLILPAPINGSATNRGAAFLHLGSLYNGTHYRLKLYNGATTSVKFAGAQPAIDATGRTNDAFRRVKVRVELKGIADYPQAAVDVTGDLCKNFTVARLPADYTNSAIACTP